MLIQYSVILSLCQASHIFLVFMWIKKLDVRLKIDFDLIFNLTNTLRFSTCVSWMEGKLGFFVRTEQFSARSTLSVIGDTDFPCFFWSVTCFLLSGTTSTATGKLTIYT